MLKHLAVSLTGLGLALGALQPQADAQTCTYFAGAAVGGQSINVDLCSINRLSPDSVEFGYYFGDIWVPSLANCRAGTWTTFPEQHTHRPQSAATQNMLDVVCSRDRSPIARAGVAIVFDPPSNVRRSPNGEIICSVRDRLTINIFGQTEGWYRTDVCGEPGFIHESQIRF